MTIPETPVKSAALLVVDDRPENLLALRELIARHIPGCEVLDATCAADGLRMALERELEGVLVDAQMRETDGIEMCAQLKANPVTRHVPVLLITAHASSPDLRVRGLEAGADDFISRPIDNAELAARINLMLRVGRTENELRASNNRLEKLVAERTRALEVQRSELEARNEELRAAQREPEASRDGYAELYDSAAIAYLTLDSAGTILEANLTAASMLGIERTRLSRMRLSRLVPVADRDELGRHFRRVFSQGTRQSSELRIMTAGGRPRDVRLETVAVEPPEGSGTQCRMALIDITDRKGAEDALRRSHELLDSIRRAQSLFIAQADVREVFGALLQTLVSMTGSECGFLDEVARNDDGTLYKRSLAISDIAWDDDSRRLYQQLVSSNLEFKNLDNLAGAPALSGRLVIANDAAHDPRSGGLPRGHPAIRNFMGIPLRFGGELVGVAGVANRPGGYDEQIAAYLEPFTSTCASIIQAARNERRERQITNALRDSEARFRTLVDNIPGAVYRCAYDAHCTTGFISEAVEDITGYPAKSFLHNPGRSFASIVHPDDRQMVDDTVRAAVARQEPYVLEYRVIHADGNPRWLYEKGQAVFASDGAVAHLDGAVFEITDQKRAEEGLRGELDVKRALAEVCNELIAASATFEGIANTVLDCACRLTKSRHGYVSAIEPKTGDNIAYTLTGMMESCPVSEHRKGIRFRRQPDGRYTGLWGYALNTREPFFTNSPERHESARGTPVGHIPLTSFLSVPALVGDELVGQIALANAEGGYTEADLEAIRQLARLYALAVERKYADEALKQNMRLNQVLLDGFPCVALLLRPQTREIVASNEAAARVGAVPGATCYSAWAQREDPCPWCLAPEVWATGAARQLEVESQGTVWDAHWVPVSDNLYMHYAFDITERRRAEEQTRELASQLHQAHKMEAIGQLASGVAHDFNNVLTAISGYTELARATITNNHEALDLLEEVDAAAAQAAGITRSLLTFTCKTATRKEPVDLREVVTKSVRLLRRVLPAGIDLRAERSVGCPVWVHADATQLQQVLMNLVINARDAMPDGGTLRVSVSAGPAEREGASASAATGVCASETTGEGLFARLVVSDTGTGMAPEVRERVFEPFFSTKPRGSGTGLGLAIIHGIVKDHGGWIDLQSEVGQGTTFAVMLPALAEQPSPKSVASAAGVPRGRGELILLCEDNRHVRPILRTSLESFGYEVVEAADGVALIERFARHRSSIRLLIVDIDLPKRNGLDCLREIRSTGQRTPAIIITAKVDAELEGRIDPQTHLLRKPFHVPELGRLVGRILAADSERSAGRA